MWWRRLAIVRAGLSGCGDAVNVLDYVLDLGRIAVKRRGMTDATETFVPKPWISGIAPYVPGKSAGADGRPLIDRKSVVKGKRVLVRGDLGDRRIIKKITIHNTRHLSFNIIRQ